MDHVTACCTISHQNLKKNFMKLSLQNVAHLFDYTVIGSALPPPRKGMLLCQS